MFTPAWHVWRQLTAPTPIWRGWPAHYGGMIQNKDVTSYIAAIDQGTTSTRTMIFDQEGHVVAMSQREHRQIFPRSGWVEHDSLEIWENTVTVTQEAIQKANVGTANIVAVGVTNQRETTVVWDKNTGKPIYNAIVWQDTRTDGAIKKLSREAGADRYREKTGLPLATYFSGPKIAWLLDNVEGARAKAEAGDLLFGTMDTWLAWNMTGGSKNGIHITDVTNASRTLLMDINTMAWDADIAGDMGIPVTMLPKIVSSSEKYGDVTGIKSLAGVPIAGILRDQQAAIFGQACLSPGDAKNTYGTGSFVLLNTGHEKVLSRNGLLTTVCYQLGDKKPVYALEGSIAVTGSLIQWIRDNLGIIASADEVEELARGVDDNGDVYFVPAFSGLFAPHWRSDARGAIVGLTRFSDKRHIARAALEASAFQTREVIEAMKADAEVPLTSLKVDGGMAVNELLMQFQSDVLNVPVIRPVVNETTALGAAYAAGLAVGFWDSEEDIRRHWTEDVRWNPTMDEQTREKLYGRWKKAVSRTLDWVDE